MCISGYAPDLSGLEASYRGDPMPHTLPDLANSAEEAPDTTMDLDKPRVNLEDLQRQEKLRKDEEKYETWVVSTDIYPGLSF